MQLSIHHAAAPLCFLAATIFIGSCSTESTNDSSLVSVRDSVAVTDAATDTATDGATAPLLEGIGPLHFQISTDNPRAQQYFDQALTLAFGFNHAEAVRSFKEAARLDATCGICYAGAALALGPNINAPMTPEAVAPAWEAIQQAVALRDFENPLEQAYIDAISTRYSEQGDDRKALDVIYAGSMAGLAEQYPGDLTARTLHAESLMDLMPWEYWNDDGTPANQNTVRFVEELEYVMAADPKHPGAAHLYIHAMERFEPEKAVSAADRLGPLVPVAGHLVHMPSHIYLRVGRYEDAVNANAKAASADEDYISQCNAQGMYPAAYYPHNIHFLWYAAMMEGRKGLAIDSALKLAERVPLDVAAQMGALQSYVAVPVYTYIRFGMWQEVLALPPAPSNLPFTQAMSHYGRGLAHAALGQTDQAEQELATLTKLAASEPLLNLNMRRPGVTADLIGIAQSLVEARLQRDAGNTAAEITALQQAVKHQDALPYTEPPLWHYPVRQTLGDAQMRAGDYTAAADTFAQDLVHFPMNPWSLYGAELAQQGLGEDTTATIEQRRHAWRNADIEPAVSW
jgi:tetratricopeptide (TPR) repeat protein